MPAEFQLPPQPRITVVSDASVAMPARFNWTGSGTWTAMLQAAPTSALEPASLGPASFKGSVGCTRKGHGSSNGHSSSNGHGSHASKGRSVGVMTLPSQPLPDDVDTAFLTRTLQQLARRERTLSSLRVQLQQAEKMVAEPTGTAGHTAPGTRRKYQRMAAALRWIIVSGEEVLSRSL